MTVQEMIDRLSLMDPDARVMVLEIHREWIYGGPEVGSVETWGYRWCLSNDECVSESGDGVYIGIDNVSRW